MIANSRARRGEGGRIAVVTGPNMAGKSTYLRQNALIAALAQMGCFVPAKAARIGIVDRLFSRVGAADDLARGRSTFMVEMVETAAILNQATDRSLVILDEIGRGTATYDGLSIAQACVERLNDVNRCRTLFATHFHELTQLAETMPRLFNLTMRVREHRGQLVFLHEVAPGVADRSYGVQVARLAGLPPAVVKRAQALLAELEGAGRATALPLFAHVAAEAEPPRDPLRELLAGLDPDALVAARRAGDALRTEAPRRGGLMDAKILLASGVAAYLYVISPGPAFLALFTLAARRGAGRGRSSSAAIWSATSPGARWRWRRSSARTGSARRCSRRWASAAAAISSISAGAR